MVRGVWQALGAAEPVGKVVGGFHGRVGEDVAVVAAHLAAAPRHHLGPRPQGPHGFVLRRPFLAGQLHGDRGAGDAAGDVAAQGLRWVGGPAKYVERAVHRCVRDPRLVGRQDAHRAGEEPAGAGVGAGPFARLRAEDLAVVRNLRVRVEAVVVQLPVRDGAARFGEVQHPARRDESPAGRVDAAPPFPRRPPGRHDHGRSQQVPTRERRGPVPVRRTPRRCAERRCRSR